MNHFQYWRWGSSSQFAVSTTTTKRANWMVGNSMMTCRGGERGWYRRMRITSGSNPARYPDWPYSLMTHIQPSAGAPDSGRLPARGAPRRPRYRLTRRGRVVFVLVPLVVLGGIWLMVNGGGELSLAGIEDGAVLGADVAQPRITLTTDEPTDELVVTLDGDPLSMTSGAVSYTHLR